MGLLDPLRALFRRAMEPLGADPRHPMWSEDPLAPDGPDPDPDAAARKPRRPFEGFGMGGPSDPGGGPGGGDGP